MWFFSISKHLDFRIQNRRKQHFYCTQLCLYKTPVFPLTSLLRNASKLNQWRNDSSWMNWFHVHTHSALWIFWISLPPSLLLVPAGFPLQTFFPFTFLLFFPFPPRVPKSKLLLLLRAGLCNSNLCNQIARLNTSMQPAERFDLFARVQSQVFQIYIIDLVSQGERERDMWEITVRMALSIRSAECKNQRSQVDEQTRKHSITGA